MKKVNLLFFVLVSCLSLTACISDSFDNEETTSGEGQFQLFVLNEEIQVEDLTRAAEITVDVNSFKVNLKDAQGVSLISNKPYSDLQDGDRTLPSGVGYRISVESCSEAEALSTNDGWGQARFYGNETFDIVSDQTTPVTVSCSMENAGLMVIYDATFTSKFPTCAATTQDARALVFKTSTADNVAYYNMTEATGEVPLRLTGSAGGWSDRIDMTKNIPLTKGKVTRLTVKYDENSGDINIEFDTDKDITEDSDDVTIE